MKEIKINPIGEVRQTKAGFEIKLRDEFKDALIGVNGFSHLNIIWWADELDDEDYRKITTVDKPYKVGPDKLGIYATRSPLRPNPICSTIVYAMDVDAKEGIIKTPYIDANPGTPVLDIKVYFPCSDYPEQSSVPQWAEAFPKSIEASSTFDWSTIFNFEY